MRLVEALSPYIDPVAVTAMRYWHPLTAEAVEALRQAGPLDEIVLLPLYPHFSYATTLSSLKEWRRVLWCGRTADRKSAPSDSFTIIRSTFRRWCSGLARSCGNFRTARAFIWSSARTGCR